MYFQTHPTPNYRIAYATELKNYKFLLIMHINLLCIQQITL